MSTKKKGTKGKRWYPSNRASAEIRRQLRKRDGDICCICDMPMLFGKDAENSDWCNSVDHIQRRDEGGSNDMNNLRLIHRVCNNFLDEIHRENQCLSQK